MKIENIDALYQIWSSDDFDGSTIIFVSEEVVQLSDPALENLVKNLSFSKIDSSVTIKRKPNDYTFVNFNFKVKDLFLIV